MFADIAVAPILAVQPPPPPPPSQAAVPPPQYAAPPPPKRGVAKWPWILLGCGCLLVILALVGSIWGGAWFYRTQVAPEIEKVKQDIREPGGGKPAGETTPEETTGASDSTGGGESGATGDSGGVGETSSAGSGPSRESALKAALEGHPKWVGKITSVSDDLRTVKVLIGPPQSEFAAEVTMGWEASLGRYLLRKVRPITSFDGSSGSAGPRPSKEAAIAVIRSLCDKGWVIKVVKHSDDWKKVTLATGPPASEFIGEVDLEWKGSEYEIVRERSYD